MSRDEPSGPDLDGVVADANAVGLPYVVIGGFSVMANGFLRATKDSDLLVPDGDEADAAIMRFFERIEAARLSDDKVLSEDEISEAHHLRVKSRHGIVDLLRGGLPPLDYESVAAGAMEADVAGFGRARGLPRRAADRPDPRPRLLDSQLACDRRGVSTHACVLTCTHAFAH